VRDRHESAINLETQLRQVTSSVCRDLNTGPRKYRRGVQVCVMTVFGVHKYAGCSNSEAFTSFTLV
jgi:hypothetical protein